MIIDRTVGAIRAITLIRVVSWGTGPGGSGHIGQRLPRLDQVGDRYRNTVVP
jgi:hypothetical protein